MRVLLANTVVLNGGDGAIADGVRRHIGLALPGAETTLSDEHATAAQALYPELDFVVPLAAAFHHYPKTPIWGRLVRDANLWRWLLAARLHGRAHWLSRRFLREHERRKLEQYAAFDVAVSTGGTYLVEHYSPWHRLTELRVLVELGVPLVLYTQSLGPFIRPLVVRKVAPVTRRARLVLLRDERSLEHLRAINAASDRCHVVADVVFTFAEASPLRELPPAPRSVAISVREWSHGTEADSPERYREAISRLVTHLVLDMGAEVTFVSTCQGVADYQDDSAEALRIADGLPPDVRRRVTVDRAFRRSEDLREYLRGFDCVVSTRMHMAILALCVGVPVLPIAYEFKTRELFRRLGLDAYVRDFDGLEPEDLATAFDQFWTDRDTWWPILRRAIAAERTRADSAIDLLKSAL